MAEDSGRVWFYDSDTYGRQIEESPDNREPFYKVHGENDNGGSATFPEWPTYPEAVAHRTKLIAEGAGSDVSGPYTRWSILRFGYCVQVFVVDESDATSSTAREMT